MSVDFGLEISECLDGLMNINKDLIHKVKKSEENLEESESVNKNNDYNLMEDNFKKPVLIDKLPKAVKVLDRAASDTAGKNNASDYINNGTEPLVGINDLSQILPYKEPVWSGLLKNEYYFEVLKNGIIIDKINIDRAFLVFGRSTLSHVVLEHPSVSRFHCIIQSCPESGLEKSSGLYLYDLNSSHGSYLNKQRLFPNIYQRVQVGHMVHFGGSTRKFILQGPMEDQDTASELRVNELQALSKQKAAVSAKKVEVSEEESGIDWGFAEDANGDDECDDANPFAFLNDELYLYNPKKSLRGWFQREGYDLPNYEVDDLKPGYFKCKVQLPLPGSDGEPLVAIVEHKGKKKDVVAQCALEACRLLNKKGLFRQAKHESHERKKKLWAENDYYDSDEDDFLDRTGDIQKKRKRRMLEDESSKAMTYNELIVDYEKLMQDIKNMENKIKENDRLEKQDLKKSSSDDFEEFLINLKPELPNKDKKVVWKVHLTKLKEEEKRLRKLINVARPFGIAELKCSWQDETQSVVRCQKLKIQSQKLLQKSNCTANINSEKKNTPKTSTGVHRAFYEEEEVTTVNLLSRLDSSDDGPQPIPYEIDKNIKKKSKVLDLKNKKEHFKVSSLPKDSSAFQQDSFCVDYYKMKSINIALHEMPIQTDECKQDKVKTAGTVKGPVMPPPEFFKKNLCGTSLKRNKNQNEEAVKEKIMPEEIDKDAYEFDSDNPEYNTWVPPSGQTGDGKTSLNERFGY